MTPLIKIQNVYLKREDQNPTGSAKDRAVSHQVDNLIRLGHTAAVISSTGNAAISADHYCYEKNISLTIFVSPKVNPQKLLLITHSKIIITDRPISEAFQYSKHNSAYFLRQSTDPIALTGYQEIGEEIATQLPAVTSIFIPVGSGTTLLGISRKIPKNVKLFAVQPASHCPISATFDKQFTAESNTLTDSLSAKLLHQKHNVIKSIMLSNGSGVVVQNSEVISNFKRLKDLGILTAPEGALALSGYEKAKIHHDVGNFPVILLTGSLR